MKCPNCGNEIYADETIDTEDYDNAHVDTVVGECSNCHKAYMWEEIFRYVKAINIEEITSK